MTRSRIVVALGLGLGLVTACDLNEGLSTARDPHNDGILVGGIIPRPPNPTIMDDDRAWLMGSTNANVPNGANQSVALSLNAVVGQP